MPVTERFLMGETMNQFTRLSALLCMGLTISAVSGPASAATTDEQILVRLNALEKENAALRTRLNRIEMSERHGE